MTTPAQPPLSANIVRYGSDEPLAEQIPLRAGPLTLIYEAGDLRYLRLGDHEILRRIYVAVRDGNWGTIPPRLHNIEWQIEADSFRVSYDVEHTQREIDFRWRAMVTGDRHGTITFRMDGQAHTTFSRNRIGFCILHPSAAAGAECVVEHVDGTTERATLPTVIVADQPVAPFAEMRALTQVIAPGVQVMVRFAGDTFEMEDQRNWTDASYKTFCTPLHLPYPVEVEQGTQIQQSVTITLDTDGTPLAEPSPTGTLRFALTDAVTPLPPLGLSVATHGQALSERELARLKHLQLHHLRVELRLADPSFPTTLARAIREARALQVSLEVALLLSAAADDELRQLRAVVDRMKPPVSAWLIFPDQESPKATPPVGPLVTLARQHLTDYNAIARFGAGTNSDFFLLNHHRPPTQPLDFVTFVINPQVHAFDNASLVETLAAQAEVVRSARGLSENLPVIVSPVTLKPRFNPYAGGPPVEPAAGELPPQVDSRQMSLFGAGWTIASIKYLAQSEVARATFYETTGWRGVMETEDGPLSGFPSLSAMVFPVYHALADVSDFAGGTVVETMSSDSLLLDGIALRKDGRVRLILANMTNQPQTVSVMAGVEELLVRALDETNVVVAMTDPDAFRAQSGELMQALDGVVKLTLRPYALVRIDPAER